MSNWHTEELNILILFFRKDGSKEPIVEMRTEDERITNHEDGSPVNEPNETTPLTEPEYVAPNAYICRQVTVKCKAL